MPLPRFLKRMFSDPAFSRKRAFLKSLDLFRDLGFVELGHLVQNMHGRTYHEGEVLFVEGDIGRALFILESGKIELTKAGADGKPQKIHTIAPGEFFGEMALIDDYSRSASVRALEDTECLELWRWDFRYELHRSPSIAVEMLPDLSRRLRQTDALLTT